MTQVVKFPDGAWAQLATLADRQGVRIADLIVLGAQTAMQVPIEMPVCEREHVTPRRDRRGRPPAVDWTNRVIADRIQDLHDRHRTVGDVAEAFGVTWDAMRLAYRHLGITPHHSKNNTKENDR